MVIASLFHATAVIKPNAELNSGRVGLGSPGPGGGRPDPEHFVIDHWTQANPAFRESTFLLRSTTSLESEAPLIVPHYFDYSLLFHLSPNLSKRLLSKTTDASPYR